MHCLRCTSYRHKTAKCTINKFCENCFNSDHSFLQCRLPPTIRCNICYRANTETKNCDCENQGLIKNMQGLRLVGDDSGPAPLIDVHIYTLRYVALVATNQSRTYISTKVVEDYDALQNITHIELHHEDQRVGLELHISIENRLVLHSCIIKKQQMPYDIIIGMDFLRKFGFSLSIGKFTINKFSPIFSTAEEIQYWRKVIVVNGPPVQKHNAKVLFVEDKKVSKHVEVDHDILEIHPSYNDLELN